LIYLFIFLVSCSVTASQLWTCGFFSLHFAQLHFRYFFCSLFHVPEM